MNEIIFMSTAFKNFVSLNRQKKIQLIIRENKYLRNLSFVVCKPFRSEHSLIFIEMR